MKRKDNDWIVLEDVQEVCHSLEVSVYWHRVRMFVGSADMERSSSLSTERNRSMSELTWEMQQQCLLERQGKCVHGC